MNLACDYTEKTDISRHFLAPFDNAPPSETDRRSDATGNAILDTLAIGETQLYDPLTVASVLAKYIDRYFPDNVGVHGKYTLASPQ